MLPRLRILVSNGLHLSHALHLGLLDFRDASRMVQVVRGILMFGGLEEGRVQGVKPRGFWHLVLR